MPPLPQLLLMIAVVFFVVAGAITARSKVFDWQNFGLAAFAAAFLLGAY